MAPPAMAKYSSGWFRLHNQHVGFARTFAPRTGFLTFEAVISYPFHPLVGQTVLVVGDREHDGCRYFLIRQSHGGSYQVPAWMFDTGARSCTVVAVPPLPVSPLLTLRDLVDHLVTCPPDHECPGGIAHDKAIPNANGSVRHAGPVPGVGRRRPQPVAGRFGRPGRSLSRLLLTRRGRTSGVRGRAC